MAFSFFLASFSAFLLSFFLSSVSSVFSNPDKICDQISDIILDNCLEQDPNSKVAIETVAKSNMILLAGEITTNAKLDIDKIVREKIKSIGYDDEKKGLDYKTCEILQKITLQSKDISQAVHENKKEEDLCAGDQGLMFGYATNETKELFPFSHLMALKLSHKLTDVRKKGEIKYLRPDGKTQVTVEYKEIKGKMIPLRVETILISAQHEPEVSNEQIRKDIIKYVIEPIIPKEMLDEKTKYYINPSGKFIIGGPEADAGCRRTRSRKEMGPGSEEAAHHRHHDARRAPVALGDAHAHGRHTRHSLRNRRGRILFARMLGRGHVRRVHALPPREPVGAPTPPQGRMPQDSAPDAPARAEHPRLQALQRRYRAPLRARLRAQRHRHHPRLRRPQRRRQPQGRR